MREFTVRREFTVSMDTGHGLKKEMCLRGVDSRPAGAAYSIELPEAGAIFYCDKGDRSQALQEVKRYAKQIYNWDNPIIITKRRFIGD